MTSAIGLGSYLEEVLNAESEYVRPAVPNEDRILLHRVSKKCNKHTGNVSYELYDERGQFVLIAVTNASSSTTIFTELRSAVDRKFTELLATSSASNSTHKGKMIMDALGLQFTIENQASEVKAKIR
jgi:hypothetical protein